MDFLSNKAHLRIICTARYATSADLNPAVELLKSWGLRVSLGNSIDKIHHQMGGDTDLRAQDFLDAYFDDDIDMIWIARGGYGTVQVIDKMDVDGITLSRKRNNQNSKLIIGYSDITYLHARLNRLGIASIHGFMPLEITSKPVTTIESLKKVLSGETHHFLIPNNQAINTQEITGTIIGGNLSILYGLLGSDDFPDTDGTILFIEDIDEYLYHIERMMFSLKRAGKLSRLKALVVGGMTDMNDHDIPFGKDVREIIHDITSPYDYPVIFDFPAGHLSDHRSIILGSDIRISITTSTITFKQQYGTT